MVKKKKIISPEKQNSWTSQDLSESTSNEPPVEGQSDPTSVALQTTKAIPSFKSKEWVSSRYSNNSKKSKVWKSLKQILSSDKSSAVTGVSYAALDCPPSTKPAKRYSDLSGLPAKYKDPMTGLLYHNLDEFASIKTFSNDIINGYLELRKANV